MRVHVILYVNGLPMRNWNFIHRSEGVPEYSEMKIDLEALNRELYGYGDDQPSRNIIADRVQLKVETHPE